MAGLVGALGRRRGWPRRGWVAALTVLALFTCGDIVLTLMRSGGTGGETAAQATAKAPLPPSAPRLSPSPSPHSAAAAQSAATFSIVVLTYKAPKSLLNALRSFARFGLLAHPLLLETIVYFQAFDEPRDSALISGFVRSATATAGSALQPGPRIRVIGSPENLPVARATFAAVRQVQSRFVLYLECDRPLFPFFVANHSSADGTDNLPDPDADAAATAYVTSEITRAIRHLTRGAADLFRMQLYAGPALAGEKVLPAGVYGPHSHERCLAAPALSDDDCRHAKKRFGPVFNTAYCKHWKKFKLAAPQRDLCDSFCFLDWAFTQDPVAHPVLGAQHLTRFAGGAALGEQALPRAEALRLLEVRPPTTTTVINSSANDTHHENPMVCMTSETCNWTNQPTMYSKAWFLASVAQPCEANPRACVGHPGRTSAVLQEQFFKKNDRFWAQRRHRVCLSQGLFYHHEVDNRERGAA